MIYTHKQQSGFAMLFTILIVGLILSIAVGISNLTLRQTLLSSLAKDSGIAFYQADAAVECGMYQTAVEQNFQFGSTLANVPPNFMCGDIQMVLDDYNTDEDKQYFVYKQVDPVMTGPCFSIIFDKSHAYDPKPYYSV